MEILGAAFAVFIVTFIGYLLIHGPIALIKYTVRALEKAPETPATQEADAIMARASSQTEKSQTDGE